MKNSNGVPMGSSLGRSPVALFVHRRLDHLKLTVEALRANEGSIETDLVVFSDGARRADEVDQVRAVRDYINQIDGFRSVKVVARDRNFGLSRNIISGVTDVLGWSDSAIVLEDDMVSAPHFLTYMNDALRLYADSERVASVHAYCPPTSESLPDTFFLPGADCWGWGTWRHSWAKLNTDGKALLAELERRGLCKDFDLGGAYPYTDMLKSAIAGRVDSWAILWYASAYLRGMLSLHPGVSLIRNIGNDGTGTHCATTYSFDVKLGGQRIEVARIPVEPDLRAREVVGHAMRATKTSVMASLMNLLFRGLRSNRGPRK